MVIRTRSLLSVILIILVILASGLLAGCGNKQETAATDDIQARARAMVEAIASGDYSSPVRDFDTTMQREMPPDLLQQAWEGLLEAAGPFQSITGTRTEQADGYQAVLVTCRFSDALIDIRVVYDQDLKVAGFFYVPAQVVSEYEPPSYVDTSSFTESEVTVGGGEWALPGTLSMPVGEGPFPAVVLVHGSGPNNRDEGFGPVSPFKDLAWGLASRGIAVLRYDKRTFVYQAEIAATGGDLTIEEETIDDAAAAVELLLNTDGIDPQAVFVLGHSLGGMVIPRIAAAAPDARGFIVLAGPARPMEDLILEQTEYILGLDGELDEEDKSSLMYLRMAVGRVKDPGLSPDTPGSQLPLGGSGRYWISLRECRPTAEASSIGRPLLILQGERDYQVTMADFALWQEALAGVPGVTFKSYPDLNHLFMTGTGKSTPDEYQQPGHVSQEVVDDIAAFVLDNS